MSYMEKSKSKAKAYCDTGAFISFLERSDRFHELFSKLFADPPQLVTSALVIQEGHGWFLKRYDSHSALKFLDFINSLKLLTIRSVSADDLDRGTQLLRRYHDQPLTLTDAVGLALMKAQNIRTCWSTDHHLSLSGARLIIHER